MKKKILLLVQLAVIMTTSFAQPTGRKFGIEANQFIIGSGFSSSSELQVFVSDERGRRLSLGVFYDYKYNNVGGISTSFQKMLRKQKKSYSTVLEPYIFYNFIYRKTTIALPEVSEDHVVAAGSYKSMEHHIGLGLRTNISKRVYINSELGYGVYMGSIMKPSEPDLIMNESYGTNGTGVLVKIGMGIIF
jgi:hypothetical protein